MVRAYQPYSKRWSLAEMRSDKPPDNVAGRALCEGTGCNESELSSSLVKSVSRERRAPISWAKSTMAVSIDREKRAAVLSGVLETTRSERHQGNSGSPPLDWKRFEEIGHSRRQHL
jgi:hypothetical protein